MKKHMMLSSRRGFVFSYIYCYLLLGMYELHLFPIWDILL